MPANLTPQYYEAERKYKEASTPQEKLDALKLMLAEIPKHKGTEKLQGDIKKKIAKTKSDLQKAAKQGPKTQSFYVRKEGAGQVAFVGPPNTGKSSIIASLSKAKTEVADYPFSTREPCPGMMKFENIQIQLVDLPPISADYMESWVPNIIRNADIVAFIIDLSAIDPLDQVEITHDILQSKKLEFVKDIPEEPNNISIAYKKTLLFGNKYDLEKSKDAYHLLQEMFDTTFNIYPLSIHNEELLEQFKRNIFSALQIVRVYSKPPGKDVDRSEPFVLSVGSTLFDLANSVHREFAHKLRFARVWGKDKYDGQRVNREYELVDGDIIELHI